LFLQQAVGVGILDSHTGRFLRVNRRYAEIVGLSAEQMCATDFMAITHQEDLEEDLGQMARLRAGEIDGFAMEKRYHRPDGALVWVELTVTPMWSPGEEPTTHIAMVEDITARKKAERMLAALNRLGPAFLSKGMDWDQAMADSLAWLGEAAQASRAYVFRLYEGADGVLYSSQEYEWVAEGVSPQIDNPALQDVPVVEAGFGRWIEVLANGGVIAGPVTEFTPKERGILDPQGILSVMVVPIAVGGAPWGFLGFDACEPGNVFSAAEVSVLRNAAEIISAALEHGLVEAELDARELELYAAQKMKAVGQLAGGIAHDFNNALTVILGNLGLALNQIESGHPARAFLEEVDKAAERSSAVARQLLQVSRRQAVEACDFDLHVELDEVVRLIRPLLGTSVKLEVASTGRLPLLSGDPGQIGQVILNLCLNSREAMPGGGRIQIRTSTVDAKAEVDRLSDRAELFNGGADEATTAPRARQWVVLTVRDTGRGMSPEVLRDVFQPFYSTKDPSHGAGLGLAVVHGIVAKHGGLVDAESEPGVGTTIRVYLPWRGTEEATPAPESRARSAE